MSQPGLSFTEAYSAAILARVNNGPHFTDPKEFYRSLCVATALTYYTSAGAANLSSNGAGNWPQSVDLRGVYDSTAWTADTYKTILSVSSGKGIVSNFVGPTGLAGTPTTTVEFTIDGGTPIEVAILATTTGQRAIYGASLNDGTAGAYFTTAKVAVNDASSDATHLVEVLASATVMPWQTIRALGTPCLMFRKSLLVRAKSSETNSTTTNLERSSGLQYMLMS